MPGFFFWLIDRPAVESGRLLDITGQPALDADQRLDALVKQTASGELCIEVIDRHPADGVMFQNVTRQAVLNDIAGCAKRCFADAMEMALSTDDAVIRIETQIALQMDIMKWPRQVRADFRKTKVRVRLEAEIVLKHAGITQSVVDDALQDSEMSQVATDFAGFQPAEVIRLNREALDSHFAGFDSVHEFKTQAGTLNLPQRRQAPLARIGK